MMLISEIISDTCACGNKRGCLSDKMPNRFALFVTFSFVNVSCEKRHSFHLNEVTT